MPDAFQRVQAVHSGEPDIKQHDFTGALLQLLHAGLAALSDKDFVSFVFKDAAEGFANIALVVHHQDVMHSAAPRLLPHSPAAVLPRTSLPPACFLPHEWSHDGPQ